MRAVGVALGLVLTLAVAPVSGSAAWGDEGRTPTQQEVRDARAAARDQARDVATVQAELASANARLQESAVVAARAAETWNGARYRLDLARQAAEAAGDRAGIARTDVDSQQQAYADALVSSYEMSPAVTAFASIAQADGIGTVMEQTITMQAAESALDTRYVGFVAASTLAGVAVNQAQAAEDDAEARQVEARKARDSARAAADAAAAEAQTIAARKGALIAELAELQDISVELAQERQVDLEHRAAEAAAAATQAAEDTAQAAPQPDQTQQPAPSAGQQQDNEPAAAAAAPAPPEPEQPAPVPPTPAPSGGAAAAVAFARAQIGDPYRWGAAGPDAWDCSGLTMGAWSAGGKSLPHYSVAQYEQSTRISSSSLQPGDLVFWGSSSSASSIYHMALYVGNGQIIHAPRTGRTVTQESMYYWIPPNFFARP